jgi:anthranilate/para-aminobenzoate synthase component I
MNNSNIYSYFYLNKNKKLLRCTKPRRARIHYAEYELDLLTGKRARRKLSRFFSHLEEIKLNFSPEMPHVFHLFYEMGYLFNNYEQLRNDHILAIELEYSHYDFIDLPSNREAEALVLRPFYAISENHYRQKFEAICEYLTRGDCYQVNLTFPSTWTISEPLHPLQILNHFFAQADNLGAFAHATVLNEKIYLSNSPECLFSRLAGDEKYSRLLTMPIKGSIAIDSYDEIDWCWEKLTHSTKEQAELYMITDLLRSDLTRVTKNRARVLKLKQKLIVPGILHQYSVIESKIKHEVSLLRLLKGIFPGGSITGAPKRRVMEIIEKLEIKDRNFYCGSTLLMHKSQMRASINIRSAEIDLEQSDITLGAGGAITLASQFEQEYQEMLQKFKSLLQLIS